MKKKIYFIILIFLIFEKSNAMEPSLLRFTRKIYEKNKNVVGYWINLHISGRTWGGQHIFIYIPDKDDNTKYFVLRHFVSEEIAKINFYTNANRKLSKCIDIGFETDLQFTYYDKENKFDFQIKGDVTYLYLKDSNENIKKDLEAFKYMILRNEDFKKLFEVLYCQWRRIPPVIAYVLKIKGAAKELKLEKEKYEIKIEYFPCTNVEYSLGYECDKFLDYAKMKKDKNKSAGQKIYEKKIKK